MRKNLKKYFLALAVIVVIAVASVYHWIYRVKIDGNSKMLLKMRLTGCPSCLLIKAESMLQMSLIPLHMNVHRENCT